jgi:GR25 family glycosyltransferase involved in LPS biosynthesis
MYENDRIIHDEIKLYEGEECKEYPIHFERNGNFVGCYIYEDGSGNKDNANSLLQYLNYFSPNRISKYIDTYEDQIKFISSFFKDIYIMHYTKLADRRQNMEKQLKNMLFYNFFNIHWIDQFDREVITEEMVYNNYKYDPEVLGRHITLPEIANGIAHIHIIESIIKVGLVLEDDTIFKPDFVHHLYHILKNLPPEWEIICLGGPTEEGVYPNNTIPGSIRNEFESNEIVFAKPMSRAIQTMSCFLINDKGKNKLLSSKYFKPRFSGPIDHIAWYAAMEKEIELYWAQPWISYEGSKAIDKFKTTMERGF